MLYSSPCANLSCSLYSGEKSSPSGEKVVAKAPKGGKRRKDTRRICLNGLPVPISRFPLRGTPRSGKGCTRRSADMKLHCQSARQTAACCTLVHLPGSYQPLPPLTRSPSPCKQGEASFHARGPFRPDGKHVTGFPPGQRWWRQPPRGEAPEWCRNRMVSTFFVPLLFSTYIL